MSVDDPPAAGTHGTSPCATRGSQPLLDTDVSTASFHSQGDRPGFFKVLLAPWLGIFQPIRAADIFVRSHRLSFWTTFAFWCYFLASIIVLLALWGGTVTSTYTAGAGPAGFTFTITERTIAQVWQAWHAYGAITPAELILLFTPPVVLALAYLLAWFFLPTEPSGVGLMAWLQMGIRKVAAGGGVVIVVTAVVGFLWSCLWLAEQREGGAPLRGVFVCATLWSPILALWFLLFASSFAMRDENPSVGQEALCTKREALACTGSRMDVAALERGSTNGLTVGRTPLCEACGYDLSHQPRNGRCPECGTLIVESTIFGQRRSCLPWEKDERFVDWVRTTARIILSPARFYASLEMLSGRAHAQSFSRGHYWFIGFGALIWMVAEVVNGDMPLMPSIWLPVLFGLMIPLLGWITHRFVGALVATIWLARHELPAPRVLPKAFYYETPFLWLFCAFNGMIGTSIVNGNWLFKRIGFPGLFGVRPGTAVILAGNGLLILFWLVRFGRVLRAVRWANF